MCACVHVYTCMRMCAEKGGDDKLRAFIFFSTYQLYKVFKIIKLAEPYKSRDSACSERELLA